MGVRYRNTFYSLGGVLWQVDLTDSEYSSTINTFSTAGEGFKLSYKGLNERYDPFLTSSLTVNCIVNDSTFETFLTELLGAQEERFGVQIYRDAALYWVGINYTDLIDIEDQAYPYECSISFSDGIVRLKDMLYNSNSLPSGTAYSGDEDFIGHLLKCLSGIGTLDLIGTNDTFLKTAVNWYENSQDYNQGKDPLYYSRVNHGAFYEVEEVDVASTYTYTTRYDVLEMILRTFNARIFQCDGIYHVIQAGEYLFASMWTRRYKKDGSALGSTTEDFHGTLTRMSTGLSKYLPPLRVVTKTYEYIDMGGGEQTEKIYYAGNYLPDGLTPVPSSSILKIPTTKIGDWALTTAEIGAISITTDRINWYLSDWWGIHKLGSTKLNALCCEVALAGQKKAAEKFNGTWTTTTATLFNARTCITWGNKKLVPMLLNINPYKDEINGEWFNIDNT